METKAMASAYRDNTGMTVDVSERHMARQIKYMDHAAHDVETHLKALALEQRREQNAYVGGDVERHNRRMAELCTQHGSAMPREMAAHEFEARLDVVSRYNLRMQRLCGAHANANRGTPLPAGQQAPVAYFGADNEIYQRRQERLLESF